MALPRREIEEIIALHELEQETVDLYVEGPADEHLIRWILRESSYAHVQIYCIDTVEINSDVKGGNRGRLIELASALEGRVSPFKVTCICDRDFERWVPSARCVPDGILLFTDFANLEAYLLTAEVFDKFLRLAVGVQSVSAEQILRNIVEPLEEAFLIRLAHAQLGWQLCWIEMERSCELSEGKVEFDSVGFLTKLLQKNGHAKDRDKLLYEIKTLKPKLEVDHRFKVHGHDFTNLLCWYLKKRGIGPYSNADQVLRTLLTCTTDVALHDYPLFKEIARRAMLFKSSKQIGGLGG